MFAVSLPTAAVKIIIFVSNPLRSLRLNPNYFNRQAVDTFAE